MARPGCAASRQKNFARARRLFQPERKLGSELSGAERVALLEAAGVVTAVQPAAALLGRAVGERLRTHGAAALPLQAIVSDGRGGVECLVEIALLEQVAC